MDRAAVFGTASVGGSSPLRCTNSSVSSAAERLVYIQRAGGSSPSRRTYADVVEGKNRDFISLRSLVRVKPSAHI